MKVIGVGNSAREKGASLEDAVASFFRHFGFRVETRVKMRDKSGVLNSGFAPWPAQSEVAGVGDSSSGLRIVLI
jgi:hypothetical protein